MSKVDSSGLMIIRWDTNISSWSPKLEWSVGRIQPHILQRRPRKLLRELRHLSHTHDKTYPTSVYWLFNIFHRMSSTPWNIFCMLMVMWGSSMPNIHNTTLKPLWILSTTRILTQLCITPVRVSTTQSLNKFTVVILAHVLALTYDQMLCFWQNIFLNLLMSLSYRVTVLSSSGIYLNMERARCHHEVSQPHVPVAQRMTPRNRSAARSCRQEDDELSRLQGLLQSLIGVVSINEIFVISYLTEISFLHIATSGVQLFSNFL